MVLCFQAPSWVPASQCSNCLEDVKSGLWHKWTGLPKACGLGCTKEPDELQGQLGSQDPGKGVQLHGHSTKMETLGVCDN